MLKCILVCVLFFAWHCFKAFLKTRVSPRSMDLKKSCALSSQNYSTIRSIASRGNISQINNQALQSQSHPPHQHLFNNMLEALCVVFLRSFSLHSGNSSSRSSHGFLHTTPSDDFPFLTVYKFFRWVSGPREVVAEDPEVVEQELKAAGSYRMRASIGSPPAAKEWGKPTLSSSA